MEINANTLFKNKTEIVSQKIKALPPLVETSQEIIAILRDERLFEKLGYGQIEAIARIEDGYEIRNEKATVQVHVEYLPKDFCLGPAQFALHFDDPIQTSGLSRKFLPLGPRQSPGIEIVGEGGSIEAIHPPSPTTQSRELSRGSKWQEFTGKTTSHVRLQALPPGVQSSREIIAILSDERLYALLGNGERIEGIVKTEEGYQVRTERFTLQVHVRYVPNAECCGPVKFVLEFDDPVPN